MYNQYLKSTKELPPVLTQEKEKELIKNIEKPEAREKLIEGNLRLVAYIAKKYQFTDIDKGDLFSIGTIGLIKGIKTYNPDKNIKLTTYISRCIDNEILMYLRKERPWRNVNLFSEVVMYDKNGNELREEDIISDIKKDQEHFEKCETEQEVSNIVTEILNDLKPREARILLLTIAGKKQKEIAKKFNISQSYASRMLIRIYKKNQKYAEKNHNKDKEYKFLFLYTEESYKLKILKSVCPNLSKKLKSSGILSNKEIIRVVDKIEVTQNKKYYIIKFPQIEETFIFISDLIQFIE